MWNINLQSVLTINLKAETPILALNERDMSCHLQVDRATEAFLPWVLFNKPQEIN